MANLVITILQLNRVKDRFKQKEIDLHYKEEATNILGKLGFDPNFGERLAKRVVQQMVENDIWMWILRGDFDEDDTIILEASTSSKDGLCIRKLEGQSRVAEMVVNN